MGVAGVIMQVAGQSCCSLSVSSVVEFGLQLDSLYMCIGFTPHRTYTQYCPPDCPDHNCCVKWGVLKQGHFKSQQLYNVFQNISLVALKSILHNHPL